MFNSFVSISIDVSGWICSGNELLGRFYLFFIEFRFLRKKNLLSGGNSLPGFWKVPIFCAEVCFDWSTSILKSQEFSIAFRFWVTFFLDFWPNFSNTFLETAMRISRGFSSEQLFSQKISHLLNFSRTLCENCSECLVNISTRVFFNCFVSVQTNVWVNSSVKKASFSHVFRLRAVCFRNHGKFFLTVSLSKQPACQQDCFGTRFPLKVSKTFFCFAINIFRTFVEVFLAG